MYYGNHNAANTVKGSAVMCAMANSSKQLGLHSVRPVTRLCLRDYGMLYCLHGIFIRKLTFFFSSHLAQ